MINAAITCLLLGLLSQTVRATWAPSRGGDIKLSTVSGFFLQDDVDTDAESFDYASSNLGLLNRTYPTDGELDNGNETPQWARFAHHVSRLNQKCDDNVGYKVLVMGRHGQGWHNVAESYYGTPAWNCYWSLLEGNGTITWSDARLTPTGEGEAMRANDFFRSHFADDGLPRFESYYTSPLARCVTTANLTFAGLELPATRAFRPVVKEYFRESISAHTCDRRSSKQHIQSLLPHLSFEHGFTEEDELWREGESETSEHRLSRSKQVLEDVFRHDDATWISISSHSGAIRSLLQALGHREFRLATGQIIPVLVKAELVGQDPEPGTSSLASFTPESTCTAPPITSIEDEGCLCSETRTGVVAGEETVLVAQALAEEIYMFGN